MDYNPDNFEKEMTVLTERYGSSTISKQLFNSWLFFISNDYTIKNISAQMQYLYERYTAYSYSTNGECAVLTRIWNNDIAEKQYNSYQKLIESRIQQWLDKQND